MPRIPGKLVLLYIGDGGSPEAFSLIARGTAHSVTINNTEVEVNTKDSGGWRDVYPEGSIKSLSVTMDGVYEETADQEALRALAMSTVKPAGNFRLNLGGTRRFTGEFQVSSYQHSGETEGFAAFSVQLSSNGIITEEAVA